MIIVTGAAGFIGSNLVFELVKNGYKDVVCVDLPGHLQESEYFKGSDSSRFIDLPDLGAFIENNHRFIQMIFHMGACSHTAIPNKDHYIKYNLQSSIELWNACLKFGIPFIYASSAATYGDGTKGYLDAHNLVDNLEPLNYYGWSKNEFDKFALHSKEQPFFWAGLKFFNVYGPNENHKNGMSSVIRKAFDDISAKGSTRLFKSHNPNFKDGQQTRDFVYVKDVCDVMIYLMENKPESGILNVGTGKSRSFLDLTKSTFKAMHKPAMIEFIDTPEKLRDKYQYFTEADISKLRNMGYNKPFYSLEEGVQEYVESFLAKHEMKVSKLRPTY